jgi:LacI family transcriptional regulator
MATIKEVARLAGVSVATVSNVLNEPERVKPALQARVIQAIEHLGYIPNQAARSLRKRSTNLIGLIVADITNPFFTDLTEAIEEEATSHGYSVLLCNSNEILEREARHIQVLRSQRIDGLILAATGEHSRDRAALLSSLKAPVVLVDRTMDDLGYDTVVLNNQDAAFRAVTYLLELGHQRIAIINGPSHLRTAAGRLQGYREALLSRGIAINDRLIWQASFRERDAYDITLKLFNEGAAPTAIFAANNLMMIGLVRALSDMGLRCPDDISVISVDDFPWASSFTPRLTTLAQPVQTMGKTAVELLLGRIRRSLPEEAQQVVLEAELVLRESCVSWSAPKQHKGVTRHITTKYVKNRRSASDK